ncbi:MAG: dockerin type I domain-containing protein, partial [Phycisphaeraceae bacterium]|nr:dockerin type I domain-containing protein [Phycisphaeraceae bacterium]
YYIQNMRGDVTTVLRAPIKGVDPTYTGSGDGERPIVVERYRYSVWGIPTVYAAADINMDGLVDDTDYRAMRSAVLKFRQKPSQLVPRGDINQDGRVDVVDMKIYFMPAWQELMTTGGNGREQLSYSAGRG